MALCAQLVLTLSLRDTGIVHVYSSDTGPGLASLRYTQSHDFRVKRWSQPCTNHPFPVSGPVSSEQGLHTACSQGSELPHASFIQASLCSLRPRVPFPFLPRVRPSELPVQPGSRLTAVGGAGQPGHCC